MNIIIKIEYYLAYLKKIELHENSLNKKITNFKV